jgi:cysteine protease
MAAFVLPFAALAEGGDIAISLSGGNAALAVGDYLSVNVKFDAAVASFGGAEFNVEYDSTVLEFVSYTALLGSEADEDTAESGSGTGMLNYGGVKDGKVKILLVNAGIISGGDTSIAANTVIGNIVFKVIGQNTTGTSYKIASEGFSAIAAEKTGETETALTPAGSTFTETTVTVSDSVTYPTENAPTVYCITSEANGVVSLSLKASIADLQRLDMQLTLNGYTDITAVTDCPLNVTVNNNVATITYNAPNGSGVDMRNGVAVLTMTKSGDSQGIASDSKSIASKDANGALSPITQPNVTDDPLGGFTKGDVDMDGRVAVNDAVMVLKNAIKLMELDTQQLMLADADNDGKITVNDAVMILKKAIKLIDF